jgi:hypothetical protein
MDDGADWNCLPFHDSGSGKGRIMKRRQTPDAPLLDPNVRCCSHA